MKRFALLAAAIPAIGLMVWTGVPGATGLRIEPGGLLIQDVPIGEARSVVESSEIEFTLYNRDDISHLYRISAHRPSEAGNGKRPRGYDEIPDPSWVIPTPNVLEIPAGSSGSFDVVIDLPEDERLYNQKWAVTLAVEGRPVKGRNVALALYPALQIETRPRGPAETRPHGAVAVAPATLEADGDETPLSFEVYNNDTEPHDYLIHVEPASGKIPPSPGLSAVAVDGLVVPKMKKLSIGPGGTAQVLVKIDRAVAGAEGLRPWEQLVFVESENGLCTFVRLRMGAD